MRIGNDTIIDSAQDLASPWVSDPFWLGHVQAYSISLLFIGSPEGLFRLECSNDRGADQNGSPQTWDGVTNWTVVDGSGQLIDEAGDHTWSVADVSYRWVRVRWLPSSGTGSLTAARINTKGI